MRKLKSNIIYYVGTMLLSACFVACASQEKTEVVNYQVPDSTQCGTCTVKRHKIFPLKKDAIFDYPKDMALTDQYCYILNSGNQVTRVDLTDGSTKINTISTVDLTKEGADITCFTSDDKYIYFAVHTPRANYIQVFSLETERILRTIEFSALECDPDQMVRCDDGYLIYERFEQSVKFMNEKGEIKYSKQLSTRPLDIQVGNSVFNESPSHDIYVKSDLSDSIYIWKNEELKLAEVVNLTERHATAMDMTNVDIVETDQPFLMDYFHTSKGLVIRSWGRKNMLCDQKQFRTIEADGIRFVPLRGRGDVLAAVVGTNFLDKDLSSKKEFENSEYVLVTYDMSSVE